MGHNPYPPIHLSIFVSFLIFYNALVENEYQTEMEKSIKNHGELPLKSLRKLLYKNLQEVRI